MNAELERLVDDLIPFAEQSLSRLGKFDPYCGAITTDEVIEHRSVAHEDSPEDDEETVGLLFDSLRVSAREGSCVAIAVFADVSIEDEDSGVETDAILVVLEHVSGISLDLFIPYRFADSGHIEYGERIPRSAPPKVFVA